MSKEQSGASPVKEKLELVFEKVGALTRVQRMLICLATFLVIGGTYYYVFYMPKQEELKKERIKYQRQSKTLANYKRAAAELVKYEKQMAETQSQFDEAMKALPDKRELTSLLTGISKAGTDAGLDMVLFQPKQEIDKTFYKEIPVSIQVIGPYHNITDFLYQINRLNRIVNVNNIDVKAQKGNSDLTMKCTAVTYMFVEPPDQSEKNKKTRKKKGGRKK